MSDLSNIERGGQIAEDTELDSPTLLQDAISWVKLIVFTVAMAVLLNQFVIVNASVPTGSMEAAIMSNDRIVAFRLTYLFSDPARFDIVIFRYPDDPTELYVKRIIGLPGEEVNIINGQVFIDDNTVPLRDDFVHGPMFGDYGPFNVPDDSFFMLGDNRSNSEDSRDWLNPYVHIDNILGRAVFKYWRGFSFLY